MIAIDFEFSINEHISYLSRIYVKILKKKKEWSYELNNISNRHISHVFERFNLNKLSLEKMGQTT